MALTLALRNSRNWNLFRSLLVSEIFVCDSAWGHLAITRDPICTSILLSAVVLFIVATFEQGELTLVSIIEKQSSSGALPYALRAELDHSIINLFDVYPQFSFRRDGASFLSVFPLCRQTTDPFSLWAGVRGTHSLQMPPEVLRDWTSFSCEWHRVTERHSSWQGFTFH